MKEMHLLVSKNRQSFFHGHNLLIASDFNRIEVGASKFGHASIYLKSEIKYPILNYLDRR
jgi:hypothetical protein